jgi:hypothetical protein
MYISPYASLMLMHKFKISLAFISVVKVKTILVQNKIGMEGQLTDSWAFNNILPLLNFIYRGADKFLAQTGRKQATATEDSEVSMSYL